MSVIFFDFETGGVEDRHPNIQLAALAVDDQWNEISSFEAKIRFNEADADPEALRINHYDAAVWNEKGQPAAYVLGRFDSFISDYKSVKMVSKRTGNPYTVARLAGHNVQTFDMPRLKRMYSLDRFMPAHPAPLDTYQLALWFFHGREKQPEDLKLPTLAKWFGFLHDPHDALNDVRASMRVARTILGCKPQASKTS